METMYNHIIDDSRDGGGINYYTISKEVDDDSVSIIVNWEYRVNGEELNNEKIMRYDFKNTNIVYPHPFLSWFNLVFCSSIGPGKLRTDVDYMENAVQNGKKTAATVICEKGNKEKEQKIIESVEMTDDCDWLRNSDSYLFVFHKGSLSDYFDINRVRDIYLSHLEYDYINWNVVEKLMKEQMGFFNNPDSCGFGLHGPSYNEEKIIVGLLFGYPIESTVCLMNPLASYKQKSNSINNSKQRYLIPEF